VVWNRGSCDMDQNGVVNGLDIQPFIDTLLGTSVTPYRSCAADANQNLSVTTADIPGFVTKLLGP
jgi:Dockerin type I domain